MLVKRPSRFRRAPAVTDALVRFADFCVAHCLFALRIALGVVYVWFGFLKFFDGASPAAELATSTMSTMTFHLVPAGVSRPLLALMETLIGLGFLTGWLRRLTAVVFVVQMTGAMSSVVLASHEVWKQAPYLPTMEGQYVIKDVVLLTAGLVVLSAPWGAASWLPSPWRDGRGGHGGRHSGPAREGRTVGPRA